VAAALVFGGSGWVGRAVKIALERRGLGAVVADLSDPADGTAFMSVDVGDAGQVADACRRVAPAVVINLAYLLAPATEADLLRSERVNLAGMLHVFEACRRNAIPRCVFASSIAVYGDQSAFGAKEVAEEDRGWPAMLYGWHKLLNEASAACVERDHGIQCLALRLSTVFGPGPAAINQDLNNLIEGVAAGGPVSCRLREATEFNLLHIEDAADAFAILATAERPRHRIYNSGGEHITLRRLISILEGLRPGVAISMQQADALAVPRVTHVDWLRLRDEFNVVRPSLAHRIARDLDSYVQAKGVG
jgi:UDP-glucose 4-epimerase